MFEFAVPEHQRAPIAVIDHLANNKLNELGSKFWRGSA
jgi:hypothetical protein